MAVDLPAVPSPRHRARVGTGRSVSVNVRYTAAEFAELAAAAGRAGLTPTGYAGEAALAAARAAAGAGSGTDGSDLAAMQRELFAARIALVCAAEALARAGGDVSGCVAAVDRLDVVVAGAHRLLRARA
jgi:hypothetical protein